jgi:3-deoxy-7-phosphoheptulonate synthase
MIIETKPDITTEELNSIYSFYKGVGYAFNEGHIIITPSKIQKLDSQFQDLVKHCVPVPDDIQLASRAFKNEVREVKLGSNTIGGNTGNTVFISGPCSVESEEQITEVSKKLVECGVKILRAGCYKPRTSPYSFQGMGLDGLKLLVEMRQRFGLAVITEVRDSTHVDDVIEHTDIIQIGAKAMYDHGILRTSGQVRKPVLLKRGFGTTLKEFIQAAEFVLSGGNENVVLCERGIRTFETGTRFTLDLCGVAFIKEKTNLPVIVDPTHAFGYSYGVPDLARASTAMGIDGLLIESHPDPSVAKSDAAQQLNLEEMEILRKSLDQVAASIGRKIV